MKAKDIFLAWINNINLAQSVLLNQLEEFKNDTNVIFRPQNFIEYIGQERAKERLWNYIKGSKERNRVFPHTLLSGEPGTGKTTLAKILANELGVKFEECISSDLQDIELVRNKIDVVNGGVFFQDEIHSLPKEIAEKMYPIMEDFKCSGQFINPFTLIGATTEIGSIIDDRKPFYDRFEIILELEDYTIKELIQIGEQYRKRVFPNDNLDSDIYKIIALNCRCNPRSLIRLLKSTIYFGGNINKVLFNFGIIKNGFTEKDLKVLQYINNNERGVGLQGIAAYLGTQTKNYLYETEPYLLKNNLIVRTMKGRKITENGFKLLNELLAHKYN